MKISTSPSAGFWPVLGVFLGISSAVWAQDAKAPRPTAAEPAQQQQQGPQTPPWIVTCSNANPTAELRCRTQQILTVTQTRQRLISATFERTQPNTIVGKIALPHGLLFSGGIQVWVDEGKKRNLPILSGDENGSYADIAVNAELLNELKAGSILRIKAKTLSQDDLVMELTLNGFATAIKWVERNPS